MVHKLVLFISLFELFYHTSITEAQTTPFFRKDYTYLEATNAFYKYHTIHRTWYDARKRCALEGATFFYPEDQAEVAAVIAFWNKTQPYYHIYVGISDLLSKGVFETIDGRSVDEIYNVWGPGEPNDAGGVEDCGVLRREGTLNDDSCTKKYTFICKKTLTSLEWNLFCDLPDLNYMYESSLGKCYKFHLTPLNWTDAYSVCRAEQSYLAVINSKEEADHLASLTASAQKDAVKGDYLRGAVHLGFHNKFNDGWKTIKGTTLEQSGYTEWGNNQPDGGTNEPCGTMFYNGRLNDIACDRRCFFICEHDIGALNSAIDERFGT